MTIQLKRKSNRLNYHDYTKAGYYFVTICIAGKRPYFGHIKDEKMQLNEHGQIVYKYWHAIIKNYPSVSLDYFVIMPNHLHGIIVLKEKGETDKSPVSLSVIIKSFKQVTSKQLRFKISEFAWQKSFYDHVIRDDADLLRIREYITNNPLKWELDENNPKNL